MSKVLFHSFIVVFLTILTQLGGIAWLATFLFRRRLVVFITAYAALSIGAAWIAPAFGRVPLSCTHSGPLQMQSLLYCALNRHYVVPELAETLQSIADETDRAFPGTIVQVLDANFPFLTGFPLLPHLSHHDGRKADLAFFYSKDGTYLPAQSRSPIGYFAFEKGPTECPDRWISLRWDLRWLQALWPDYAIDEPRMRFVLQKLVDDPRVGKVFLEPHLKSQLELRSENIRFQGCRAARHDDHIHLQL